METYTKNTIPSVEDYRVLLHKAVEKFNIPFDKAREMYGRFTYEQWNKLLKQKQFKSYTIMRTTDVQRLVYKMLTENTGTHFLDSGGAYGRAWQRNQKKTIKDFMNEPEESYQFDMKYGDIYRTVSVFHYLSGLELDDTCLKFNRRNNNPADWEGELPGEEIYGVSKRAADWLNENHEVEVQYTFNTYNGDSDLSQILQGSRLEIDGDTYYLIQVHGGCDVRGGYTDAKLFKTSYYSEGIHEYLWEYKHSSEIEDDLREGYIESMTDYWDSSIVYDNETILKRIDGLIDADMNEVEVMQEV